MKFKPKNNLMLYALAVIAVVALILAFVNLTVFYVLLGVAVFLGLFWACYNYKWVRYATVVIIYLALIGGTVYCGNNLNTYYNAEGGIFGKISNIFDSNQVEEVENLIFDFSNVEMLTTGNANEYAAKMTKDKFLKIDTNKTFAVYVNESPCGFVETGADFVRANYTYVFYGEEKDEILKDTLQFRFALNKTFTEFTIKTQGGETAVRLWNYYFAKNNFTVSIKPADYVYSNNGLDFGEGEVEYALANYYVNDQQYLTQLYHVGEDVNFPFPSQITNTFLGWSLDKTNIVETYKISQNTNFYAVEGEETLYTVSYKFKDEVVLRQRVIEGQTAVNPAKTFTGYQFKYWADESGAEYDFNTPIMQDRVLTANVTAEEQTIKLYFALADNPNKYVNPGHFRYGNTNAQTNGVIAKNGDYTNAITLSALSGTDFFLYGFNQNFFKLQTDSMGRVKYLIKDYDAKNGTNKVETSIITEYDFAETGWTERTTINFKNVNTNMTILILVDPILFNINFYDDGGNQLYATARGLMYGGTFSLSDYMEGEDLQRLRAVKTNWYTKPNGKGTNYFDQNLNMLEPWTYNGYDWDGNNYVKGTYDPVTKTFSVFSNTY